MSSFGLIAEGPSDQIIIEHILSGYYDDKDLDVRPFQPRRDLTDKNSPDGYGGWTEVLSYCGSDDFENAFAEVDFVVLHIDTDCSEETGFDVAHSNLGTVRTLEELVDAVGDRLRDAVGAAIFDAYRDRIILAIAVHTTECWLLPLVYNDTKANKITGCLTSLNRALKPKFGFTIDPQKKLQGNYLAKAIKPLIKQTIVLDAAARNSSLGLFIENLPA